jgi:predicted dienelactone hydrolase
LVQKWKSSTTTLGDSVNFLKKRFQQSGVAIASSLFLDTQRNRKWKSPAPRMSKNMNINRINCWALALLSAMSVSGCKTPSYDPLLVSSNAAPKIVDLDVSDTQRKRTIPIRIYLPPTDSPAPVILFSHGLGGSREGGTYLGKHWANRGYVAVFLQHPGSDTSVWKDKPASQRMAAMREAASGQNFLDRVKDVPAVLDQLERWDKEAGHALAGKLNLTKVGMSGHSFGAVTTQAVSGQTIMGDKAPFTDPRIAAAVIMSPSSPRRGTAQSAFGKISLPWLLMTGTKDVSPIGDIDVASRLAVYPALPAGSKYELVLNAADHSAFTDRPLPSDNQNRNPNHHRSILALSTAFWDAYLLNNTSAKTWLDGEGTKSVLEKADKWQRK